MIERNFLVRLDPDNYGIGYFDLCLEYVDRNEFLTNHFDFLRMELINVYTFDLDFCVDFQSPDLKLTVYNDDPEVYPEYCDDGYLDFVVFGFSATEEPPLDEIVQLISKNFEMIEVPIKRIEFT